MQDVKMRDQVAGHENDGPSKSQGVKMQDMKMQDMKLHGMKMHDVKMQDVKMQDPKMEGMNCLFALHLLVP